MAGPSFSPRSDPRRALEGETIAINRDWVYDQTCRLSRDIHVISIFFFFLAFDAY